MDTEKVEVEDRALTYIAKAADGSMRDALSLLDQCIAFYLGQKLTYEHVLEVLGAVDIDVFSSLFRKICRQEVTDVIQEVEKIILQGRELSQFTVDFIWYLRNLLMLSTDDHMAEMLDVSAENLIRMQEEAAMTDPETLMRYIRVFSELSGQLRYATQKRVLVEIALIKLCRPSMEKNYDSLLQRISQIEQKLEQGAVCAPAAAGTDSLAQKMPAAQREKLPREAMSEDVQLFINRFQELRRKMGGMQSQQLKDAVDERTAGRRRNTGDSRQRTAGRRAGAFRRSAAYDRERTSCADEGTGSYSSYRSETAGAGGRSVGVYRYGNRSRFRIGGFLIWQEEEDSRVEECRAI